MGSHATIGVGSHTIKHCNSPVYRDGHEREHACRYRTVSDKRRELAIATSEWPVAVQHVHEVKQGVKDRNERVCNGQVHQKVVGDRTHALVRQDDPDDNHIPTGGYDYHGDE